MKVAVAGAGIAGLCAAVRLSERHDVVVLESAAEPGGKIHSQQIDGYLFDWGPNGFLSSAADLRAVVHEIGLDDAVVEAGHSASKRFIYWGGKMHALPSKPPQALGMSLLSVPGRLRALRELFVRAARSGAPDESVYEFFARRFGREVGDRLASPALLGISGGDAKATSAAAMFPRLGEFERNDGSVLRGLMRGARAGTKLTSFRGGMQRLTDGLAEKLGTRLRLGCALDRLEPAAEGWRATAGGEAIDADAVVLTTPAGAAAALVEPWDTELAALLRRIPYGGMRVCGIAFRAQDVPVPLDGFGFLAARGQGVRILGALFTSTMYPDQAPAHAAYLRIFLGGATDPRAVALDTESARAIVRDDLRTTLGITAEPLAYHEAVWPNAIPQYALGHSALVASIEQRVSKWPNLALAGNAYRGLGVGDTVREAHAAAARIG